MFNNNLLILLQILPQIDIQEYKDNHSSSMACENGISLTVTWLNCECQDLWDHV